MFDGVKTLNFRGASLGICNGFDVRAARRAVFGWLRAIERNEQLLTQAARESETTESFGSRMPDSEPKSPTSDVAPCEEETSQVRQ